MTIAFPTAISGANSPGREPNADQARRVTLAGTACASIADRACAATSRRPFRRVQ